ncbi:MAG: hypothetical protein KA715_10710 [Xanthomonadaceae bacterium]|nr:hypothetical protein [Xanthomonadaceae bacterium]
MKSKVMSSSLLISAVIVSGCGLIKNMDEMHDATMEMNDGTKAMGKDVKATKETSMSMFMEMRKDSASKDRREVLNDLETTDEIEAKLSQAKTYVDSMEYQHWDPAIESLEKREDIMAEGMRQFYYDISEFIKDRDQVSPIKTKNNMENLYAFSAALSHVSDSQKHMVGGSETSLLSPLDIMISALTKQAQINVGTLKSDSLTFAEKEVVKKAEDTIYLIRLRHNFLMAYTYALTAQSSNGNLPTTFQKLKVLMKTKLSKKYQWTPNFASRNPEQINFATDVAQNSINAGSFLRSIGYDPLTNKTIEKIQARADFSAFDLMRMSDDGQSEKALSIAKFTAIHSQLVINKEFLAKDKKKRK